MKRSYKSDSESGSSLNSNRSSEPFEYPHGSATSSRASRKSKSSESGSFVDEKEHNLLLKDVKFFTPYKQKKAVVFKRDSIEKIKRLREDPRITSLRIVKDFLTSDKTIDSNKKADFYQTLLDKILKEEKITKRLLIRDTSFESKKLLDYYRRYMKVRGLYNRANCDSLQSFPNLLDISDFKRKISTKSPYTENVEKSLKKMKISSKVYRREDLALSENNIKEYFIQHIKANKNLSEFSKENILRNLQKIMGMSYDTVSLINALHETKDIPDEDKEISFIIKKTIELRRKSAKHYLEHIQNTTRKVRNYTRDERMSPVIKERNKKAFKINLKFLEDLERRKNAMDLGQINKRIRAVL